MDIGELSNRLFGFLREKGWELAVKDSVRKRTRSKYEVPNVLEMDGEYRVVPIVPSRLATNLFVQYDIDRSECVVPSFFFEDDDGGEIYRFEINALEFTTGGVVVEYIPFYGDDYETFTVPYNQLEVFLSNLPYNVPLSADLSSEILGAFDAVNLQMCMKKMAHSDAGVTVYSLDHVGMEALLKCERSYLALPSPEGHSLQDYGQVVERSVTGNEVSVLLGNDGRFAFNEFTFSPHGMHITSNEGESRTVPYDNLLDTLRTLQYGTVQRMDHAFEGLLVLGNSGDC